MNFRSVALLLTGLALGCILVACSNNRAPKLSAQAQTPEASGQAPPDIKKGETIQFRPVGGYAGRPWSGKVLEVRGKWIKLLEGDSAPDSYWYWYNVDAFLWYRVPKAEKK